MTEGVRRKLKGSEEGRLEARCLTHSGLLPLFPFYLSMFHGTMDVFVFTQGLVSVDSVPLLHFCVGTRAPEVSRERV